MEGLEKLLKENPLLSDSGFQSRFPKIVEVAGFINESYIAARKTTGKYELFDNLGIGNMGEYLELLSKGDREVEMSYRIAKESLNL